MHRYRSAFENVVGPRIDISSAKRSQSSSPLGAGWPDKSDQNERNDNPARPFWRRLVRAVALLSVAVVAHVWLDRAPRPPALPVLPPDLRTPPALWPQLARGVALDSLAEVGRRSAIADRVEVLTELVPVGTAGLIPANLETMSAEAMPAVALSPLDTGIIGDELTLAAAAPESPAVSAERDVEKSAPASPVGIPLEASRTLAALPSATAPAGAAIDRPAAERVITAAPIVEPDQDALVLRVLHQYAAAYDSLDVDAAKAVYPSVNDTALRRAFNQLESQRVTFESCGVTVAGRDASAHCQGEAAYRPRVGRKTLHRAPREWTFNLSKADAGWKIVKATVR